MRISVFVLLLIICSLLLLIDCWQFPNFSKIVEIEDIALRVAILDEYQIHLGGGDGYPKAQPLGT